MTGVIHETFPDARFMHLHRDPRDVIPSMLSRPPSINWDTGRPRYTSEALVGPLDASPLEKFCTYWARYNARIADDLREFEHLSLKSSDLFAGDIAALEHFVGRRFTTRTLPPRNADKPIGEAGRHPPFSSWSQSDQDTLYRICGPVMERLKYV
jgi:hypothetical protein